MESLKKFYCVIDEINEELVGTYVSFKSALSSAIFYLKNYFSEDEYTEVVIEKFEEIKPGRFKKVKRFPYVSKDLCRRKTSEM